MQNYRTTLVSTKQVKDRISKTAKALGVNVSAMLKVAFTNFEAELVQKGIIPKNEER